MNDDITDRLHTESEEILKIMVTIKNKIKLKLN